MKKILKKIQIWDVTLMGGYVGVIGAVMMLFPSLGILPGVIMIIGVFVMITSLMAGFLALRPRQR